MVHDYYPYWFTILLMVIGLGGMLFKRNLMKKLIAMTIFQSAIILFFVVSAFKWGATVPVLDPGLPVTQPESYINPLPHTLMLTAIVVGVATVGVALAILIIISRRFHTLDEAELLKRMSESHKAGEAPAPQEK